MPTTHFRTCNLCEAMCGLELTVEDNRVTSIRGDKDDPFSRGHICPKALALKDIQEDPDRLRVPLRRTKSGWEPLAWDDALDLAAAKILQIQKSHGRDAMAAYLGNPNVHNYGSLLYGPPLLRALRTKNRYSATSVDQLPHHVVARLLFGHQLLLPIPDIDRTDYLLMFGANPVVSNGSLMSAPDVKRRLQAISARGGTVVVVDPRRTKTAELADQHLAIVPGTDVFALLAIAHTIFSEGLVNLGRLAHVIDGVAAIAKLARQFPPERVAETVGLKANTLREVARAFASAKSAVCYGRMGVSVQRHGTLCQWLTVVLTTLTGNLDRAGGAMFTTPAVDVLAQTSRGGVGRYHSRVRGLPEFGGELPVATLAEEILTPGEGQVRGLLTVAGNPVLSTPNGQQLDRALQSLAWMVSIDMYRNETTRHADLILPPTPPLERDHYDLVFHVLAIRNTAKFSPATLPQTEGSLHEWEILSGLHRRLVAHAPARRRLEAGVTGRLGPRRLLDLGLRVGPAGMGLQKLRRHPHGIDLGPLIPQLPARLFTRSGRIDLAPEKFLAAANNLECETAPSLLLIGRRHLRSNNSWLHNSSRLVKGKPRCTVQLHPTDAAHAGVTDGALTRVRSRVGEVVLPCEVSTEIRPGVVSIPHGWGHTPAGIALRVAQMHAGVSVNDLTDDQQIDPVSGNAVLNGVEVTVSAVEHGSGALGAHENPASPGD